MENQSAVVFDEYRTNDDLETIWNDAGLLREISARVAGSLKAVAMPTEKNNPPPVTAEVILAQLCNERIAQLTGTPLDIVHAQSYGDAALYSDMESAG